LADWQINSVLEDEMAKIADLMRISGFATNLSVRAGTFESTRVRCNLEV
jgi:hypothetical protein